MGPGDTRGLHKCGGDRALVAQGTVEAATGRFSNQSGRAQGEQPYPRDESNQVIPKGITFVEGYGTVPIEAVEQARAEIASENAEHSQ